MEAKVLPLPVQKMLNDFTAQDFPFIWNMSNDGFRVSLNISWTVQAQRRQNVRTLHTKSQSMLRRDRVRMAAFLDRKNKESGLHLSPQGKSHTSANVSHFPYSFSPKNTQTNGTQSDVAKALCISASSKTPVVGKVDCGTVPFDMTPAAECLSPQPCELGAATINNNRRETTNTEQHSTVETNDCPAQSVAASLEVETLENEFPGYRTASEFVEAITGANEDTIHHMIGYANSCARDFHDYTIKQLIPHKQSQILGIPQPLNVALIDYEYAAVYEPFNLSYEDAELLASIEETSCVPVLGEGLEIESLNYTTNTRVRAIHKQIRNSYESDSRPELLGLYVNVNGKIFELSSNIRLGQIPRQQSGKLAVVCRCEFE